MAQDNNNMSKGKTIVIIVFAVVLVASLCLPFFSSCGANTGTSGSQSSSSDDASSSSDTKTVAQVDEDYSAQIDSLKSKLAANSTGSAGLAAVASLGNTMMDWGNGLQQASDASDNEDHIKDVFSQAVAYYDQYLAQNPDSKAVTVDRAICVYYSGNEDEAISTLEEFTADDPDFSPAWVNLGIFHELHQRTDDALAAYGAAVEADAKDSYNMASYAQLRALIIQAQQQAASASSSADGSATSDALSSAGARSQSRDAAASSASSSGSADEDGIAKPIVG